MRKSGFYFDGLTPPVRKKISALKSKILNTAVLAAGLGNILFEFLGSSGFDGKTSSRITRMSE